MERKNLFFCFVSIAVLINLSCEKSMTEEKTVAKAKEIHERVLTIDTHDDIPSNFATEEVDPGVRGDRQVDIPKMQEGGLDAGFFIVYVGQTKGPPRTMRKPKRMQ